jgi:hypothetical protein
MKRLAINTESPRVKQVPGEAEFYRSIADLIQQARNSLAKSVNTTMVITHYEIGRRIVEQEQHGEKRAQYGKKILQGLSDYLTSNLGKGWSLQNLKLMRPSGPLADRKDIKGAIAPGVMRQFYVVYSIGESPYLILMRIADPDERRFYEIEIANIAN